jgi:hypothetical protein
MTGLADTEKPMASGKGDNETSETNERQRPLPFFRELSFLSLFLESHFQEFPEFRYEGPVKDL